MKKDTGHICKCGKPATYARWLLPNEDRKECEWVWMCWDCYFELENLLWTRHTCGECGYATARRMQGTSWCRRHTFGMSSGDGSALGSVGDGNPACPDYEPKNEEGAR